MGVRWTVAFAFTVCTLVVLCTTAYWDFANSELTRRPTVAQQDWSAKYPGRTLLLDTVHADEESNGSVTPHVKLRNDAVFPLVLNDLDTCLKSSNLLDENGVEAIAKSNALDFYTVLRRAVPQEFNSTYASPCWDSYFSATSDINERIKATVQDADRQTNHTSILSRVSPSARQLMKYRSGPVHSKLLCLPKVLFAGYPKCGSTFSWCFISKLLIAQGINSRIPTAEKEPHWWVRTRAEIICQSPTIDDLGRYFLNFAPGYDDIKSQGNNKEILIDGTPNMMFSWQRFCGEEQLDMANYCLLPSLLPHLIPSAKFIVVMRNPVDVLYSAFWFSCTFSRVTVPRSLQLEGPDIFHERIWHKIDHFTGCMTEVSGPLSIPCTVDSLFGTCIKQRLHLLDKCVREITYDFFAGRLSRCGRSRTEMVLYYAHTKKWLSVVPASKFLFLKLEELVAEPAKVARNIQDFLGIPRQSINVQKITSSCRQNTQKTIDYHSDPLLQMRNDTRTLIQTFYQPFNEKLAELLGDPKFLWQS